MEERACAVSDWEIQELESSELRLRHRRREGQIHALIVVHYISDCSVGIMSAIRRMNTVLVESPDDRVCPSGEKEMHNTSSLCSVNVLMHVPSLVFHNRTVLSSDADAMYDPHGEKHAAPTHPECPSSDDIMAPVDASQIFTV